MSKLERIATDLVKTVMVVRHNPDEVLRAKDAAQRQIKALMLEIIDDTVMGLGGDGPYGELRKKVEEL